MTEIKKTEERGIKKALREGDRKKTNRNRHTER